MQIELFDYQMNFMKSKALHTAMVGGFGCGKSFVGIAKTVEKKLSMPGIDVGYYLPTYPLVKGMAFKKFREYLTLRKIKHQLQETDKEFITDYGKIIMRSMDNPNLIVAYETGYALIDEADRLPIHKMDDAFLNIIARNRSLLPDGSKNQLDFVSTPEGYKFLYKMFVTNKTDDRVIFYGNTNTNIYNSPEYVENLKKTYTKEQLRAYVEGQFVNFTNGTVYKSYNRDKHNSTLQPDLNEPLFIGMDFNVQNMHAIVHIIRNGTLHAIDEFVKVYNTAELCQQIRLKYPKNKIEINPDASCKNRNTAGLSDYDIILDDQYNFEINIRRKNPEILNRVRGVNKSFEDNKYFVNLLTCPTYSEALSQQAYDKGLPDKKSYFDHINDAGTYCCIEQIYTSGFD